MATVPYAYFQRRIVPLAEAKIGIMTHAFNYGTAVFEGIRGNWNAGHKQLYLFRPEDHLRRIMRSARVCRIGLPYTVDEMLKLVLEVAERSHYQEDVYMRPLAYKSAEKVGVRLHGIEDDFLIFITPFGPYLDVTKGIRCCVSSWRRIDDNSIPARAKVTGGYINSALAKSEAEEDGYEEAILLTQDGHVSEGSGENIFLVIDGRLVTPPSSDNILIGITRESIIALAREEMGVETVERSIDRSELFTCDEVFLTGTAAHVTSVAEIDRRPVGGKQGIGPITARLQQLYFEVIRGDNPKYRHWLAPVYAQVTQKMK